MKIHPETLQKAKNLLEDGASRDDVAKTLKLARRTIQRHFPQNQYNYTQAMKQEKAQLVRKLNKL